MPTKQTQVAQVQPTYAVQFLKKLVVIGRDEDGEMIRDVILGEGQVRKYPRTSEFLILRPTGEVIILREYQVHSMLLDPADEVADGQSK